MTTVADIAAKAGTDAATVVRVLQAVRDPSLDMGMKMSPHAKGLTFIELEAAWRAGLDSILRTVAST